MLFLEMEPKKNPYKIEEYTIITDEKEVTVIQNTANEDIKRGYWKENSLLKYF